MSDENRPPSDEVNYAPAPARAGHVRAVTRGVMGAFVGMGSLVVPVLSAFSEIPYSFWVVLAVAVLAVAWLAIHMRKRPGWSSFSAGLWIGLGVGGLVLGACYAMVASMEH
jgi:hypothetical protein